MSNSWKRRAISVWDNLTKSDYSAGSNLRDVGVLKLLKATQPGVTPRTAGGSHYGLAGASAVPWLDRFGGAVSANHNKLVPDIWRQWPKPPLTLIPRQRAYPWPLILEPHHKLLCLDKDRVGAFFSLSFSPANHSILGPGCLC